MRGIILAAGRGRRMKYLTDNSPKCLLKYKGISLLERLINNFLSCDINSISIITGYKKEMILPYVKKTFYNPDWEFTNMVCSLLTADEWLKNHSCIVSYSDIFYNKQAIYSLLESNDELAVTYDPNWYRLWRERFDNPLSDAESFKINKNGSITDIGKKSENIDSIQGQFMGLIKFTPISWAKCKYYIQNLPNSERNKCDVTKMLGDLIDSKKLDVKGISYGEEWGEIDSIKDLEVYNKKNDI